jgi:hypothetical protein
MMASLSEFQLTILAILLGIVAIYVHRPVNGFASWFSSKDAGSTSTMAGGGGGKDFADMMQKTVGFLPHFYSTWLRVGR